MKQTQRIHYLAIFLCLVPFTSGTDSPCQTEAAESPSFPGAFTPQCLEDGSYAPQQCHSSTGHCWCVDSEGSEYLGTRRGPSEPLFNCTSLPQCITQAHEAQSSAMLGSYIPQCDYDGSFSDQQCHGSTGHCWCVNVNGVEILGTRSTPTDEPMDCDIIPACFLAASRPTAKFGEYIPQCNENGTFQSTQCHGSTGYCWCVNSQGVEILGSRRGPTEERFECDALPECLVSRHVASNSGMLGVFVPECDLNGDYQPQQCHSSTGQCWCTSHTGTEILGTRQSATDTTFNCTDLPECIQTAHELRSNGPLLGRVIPSCDIDGSYSPRQCHGSTGSCWCVTSTNQEIQGTRTQAGQESFDCHNIPQCLLRAFTATSQGLIGAYKPQCEADGSYSTMQCHGSTGSCWCAERSTGIEIFNTRQTLGSPRLNCSNLPECIRVAHETTSSNLLGAFTPQCEDNGEYSIEQCHTSTGTCWCAEQGQEILGTRRGPTQPHFNCSNVPECLMTAHQQRTNGGLGSLIPQCDVNGLYTPQQCHGSTGYCWCVDPQGDEVEGTRTPPGTTPFDCENVPECLLQAHNAGGLLGAFKPQCNDNGSYQQRQCHGSTGHCFCVDSSGFEIEGTRQHVSEPQMSCDEIPDCLIDAHNAALSAIPETFVPQCDSNGQYKTAQYDRLTGDSWCVDSNGVELSQTHRTLSQHPYICSSQSTLCEATVDRALALEDVNVIVPRCTEGGEFEAKQCDDSGSCWCVDFNGEVIDGTRYLAVRINQTSHERYCVTASGTPIDQSRTLDDNLDCSEKFPQDTCDDDTNDKAMRNRIQPGYVLAGMAIAGSAVLLAVFGVKAFRSKSRAHHRHHNDGSMERSHIVMAEACTEPLN